MNPAIDALDIPNRILRLTLAALTQANTHAAYWDPGRDHWEEISVLNAAQAGELAIKAVVASEHPLLIFRDLFKVDDQSVSELSLEQLIAKGRTYNFEDLPKLLRVTTGRSVNDTKLFTEMRETRNAIQHFCVPDHEDLGGLSLRFIYGIIDPILSSAFGISAIEYVEDPNNDIYDYLVAVLVAREIPFSVPADFIVGESDAEELFAKSSRAYQDEMNSRFSRAGVASPWG